MKNIIKFAFFVLSLVLIPQVHAQINVSGQWTAELLRESFVVRSDRWTLKQKGVVVTGAGATGEFNWTTAGVVDGTTFTKVDAFSQSNYIVAFSGTINAESTEMSGTWFDNFDPPSSGTWIATRVGPEELSPETTIVIAPTVQIAATTITVTMEKFNKVAPKSRATTLAIFAKDLLERAAKAAKLSVLYEVNVKGETKKQTRQKILSKRNEVTVKKLAPGNYTTTYRVKAVQGEKTVYSSNLSPASSFTIRAKE
jgi:hypothetical protein